VSFVATHSQLSSRSRAESTAATPITADVDAQTGEYYDIDIQSTVKTVTRNLAVPLYIYQTQFQINGVRIQNLTQLYGVVQNPATPYEDRSVSFHSQSNGPHFVSDAVNLLSGNCIDLYSSTVVDKSNYVATFCYKNAEVKPGQKGVAYSPDSMLAITYTYKGVQPSVVQVLTTAFNKYNNPYPFNGLNTKGIRVNYVTVDSQNSSLADFQDVRQQLQGLTIGLTSDQMSSLCNASSSFPQKYLKQEFNGKPVGGNNYVVTPAVKDGCNFEFVPTLKPFFISLYMDGGVPMPLLSSTPTSASITIVPKPSL